MTDADTPSGTARAVAALTRAGAALFVLALIAASSVYFSVPEGAAGVVTRFGRPVREITEAGAYAKLPWPVDQFHPVDRRIRLFNSPFTATFTRDKKTLVLLTYAIWRVERPLLFLQSVGGTEAAEKKLDGMIIAAKNFQMGRYLLSNLVSTDPKDIKTEEIEAAVLADVGPPALEKFGIRIVQLGLKRIAFPEENVAAVLEQMKSERKVEAERLRAEGEREAAALKNAALVKVEEILKDGREEAGKIRGRTERRAAEIYADAHRADPDFYRFWRSLSALKTTLGARATLVLRTDQGFFRALEAPEARPLEPAK